MKGTRPAVVPFHQHVFLAILALWVILPIGLQGRVPQDAIPYVAAGQLATTSPHDVYAARNGDLFDLRPHYRHAWCAIAPTGTNCDDFAVAFVASPPSIPFAWALSHAGVTTGPLLMRFGAALMLAGGMWALWRRLAHRSRRASMLLVLTALLLTPMATVPIGLGQTSPILFLSVCLGLSGAGPRRRIGRAAVWIGAALFKVFPAALVLLLVWRRKWRIIAWSALGVVLLGGLSLVIVPPATWGDFVRTTLQLSGHTTTNPYNGSVSALVVRLFGGSTETSTVLIARLASLAAAGFVCWSSMRHTDDDTRWAGGYLALLLLTPLVWWHYVWVAIGALGIALSAQRRLHDRMIAILPAAALVSVVPSIPNANGHSWPIVQALVLLVFSGVFCVLARRTATPAKIQVRNTSAS